MEETIDLATIGDDHHSLLRLLMSRGSEIEVIHCAYYNGGSELLRHPSVFTDYGGGTNYADSNGLSHLHIACTVGNVHAIEDFLKKGEDIDLPCNKDWEFSAFTPLHFAVANSQKEVIQLLLENKANINALNGHGESALHLLLSYLRLTWNYQRENHETEQSTILTLLTSYNCNVNIRDNEGATALFYLFHTAYYEKLESWCYSSIFRKRNGIPSVSAVQDAQIVKLYKFRNSLRYKIALLLSCGADTNAILDNGDTLLHWVIGSLKPLRKPQYLWNMCFEDIFVKEYVEYILEKGIDVDILDSKKRTALQYAVHYLSVDVVKVLLDHGADVANVKFSAFSKSFGYSHALPTLEVVQNLFTILDMLGEKGFTLNLIDHVLIMKFLLCKNELWEVFDVPNNLEYESANLICYGNAKYIELALAKVLPRRDAFAKCRCLLNFYSTYRYFHADKELDSLFKSIDFTTISFGTRHLENVRKSIFYNIKQKQLHPDIIREISLMKETIIRGKVTLYDILQMSPDRINAYLADEGYRKILQMGSSEDYSAIDLNGQFSYLSATYNRPNFNDHYPYLGTLIKGHFTKSLIRKYILAVSINHFWYICPIKLPTLCCRKILSYMDNSDIYAMCCAATPD